MFVCFFFVWTYQTQYNRTFRVTSNLNRFVLDRESEVLLFFPLQQLALILVVISYCITIAKHWNVQLLTGDSSLFLP